MKQESITKRIQEKLEHGGEWLGVVRRWMQREFIFSNGETVTWGSDERLGNTELTPRKMEALAADIKDAVVAEVIKTVARDERLAKLRNQKTATKPSG